MSQQLGNNTIASFRYTYDNVGNRTSMADQYGVHNYAYDQLSRLIQATHPQPPNPLQQIERFMYDTVGNRNPATNSYNAGNELVEDANYVYSYDKNGNTISKRDKSSGKYTRYYWGAKRQLLNIEEYSSITSAMPISVCKYVYNGFGHRVAKNVNNAITKYVYDEDDILLETDKNDKVLVRYTYGPAIDEPLIMQRDTNGDGVVDTTYYYIADGLGSIVKLVDTSGNVVNRYVYDSFGNMVSKTEGVPNRYAYTGREYDAESGLYYYRRRYYNPKAGRFLSEDLLKLSSIILLKQYPQYRPIAYSLYVKGLLDSSFLNYYTYVGNNPISNVDPFGLLTIPGIGWVDLGEDYAVYALEYYANIIADPSTAWYEKAGAHAGAFFSALWTPCASDKTFWTLSTAYSLSDWAANTGPEITIFKDGNIAKIVSRKGRWGYRIDLPHHGKPWGHRHFWRW